MNVKYSQLIFTAFFLAATSVCGFSPSSLSRQKTFVLHPKDRDNRTYQHRQAAANDISESDDFENEMMALPMQMSKELDDLRNQLSAIEALEERNKAQIDSFIDEQDQWDSMEPFERKMIESKGTIEARMEDIVLKLMNGWMDQKIMDG